MLFYSKDVLHIKFLFYGEPGLALPMLILADIPITLPKNKTKKTKFNLYRHKVISIAIKREYFLFKKIR
jgi:hypothetical protein